MGEGAKFCGWENLKQKLTIHLLYCHNSTFISDFAQPARLLLRKGPPNRKERIYFPADSKAGSSGLCLFWVGHLFLMKPSVLESLSRARNAVSSHWSGWISPKSHQQTMTYSKMKSSIMVLILFLHDQPRVYVLNVAFSVFVTLKYDSFLIFIFLL